MTAPTTHAGYNVAAHLAGEWLAREPRVDRLVDGVPSQVDRLRTIGNAVVPQVAEHIGRLIVTDASWRPGRAA